MSANWDKAKGAVKKGVGEATGDKKLEREGRVDKAKGHAKEAAHDIKKGAEEAFEHAADAAEEGDEHH